MLFSSVLALALSAQATIFGTVRGLIHDPQHRPVSGAQVRLHAANSDWSKTVVSDTSGEFRFDALPVGEYFIIVDVPGFASERQQISVGSSRDINLHFALTLASSHHTVQFSDTPTSVNTESSTSSNTVNRKQIAETPGADQTNSLAMITDYTPALTSFTISSTFAEGIRSRGCWTVFRSLTRTLHRTSAPNSIPRTSTTLKCSAADTTPNTATAPMACSML
jgi:hypothetical protein